MAMSKSYYALAFLFGFGITLPVDASAMDVNVLLDRMTGRWSAVLQGNTGCGSHSMFVTFRLDAAGQGAGTARIVNHSTGCGNRTSTGEDFMISDLNSNGRGKAHLSCGAGCGWEFEIQVARSGR